MRSRLAAAPEGQGTMHMNRVVANRRFAWGTLLALTAFAVACLPWSGAPAPQLSSLIVRNTGFYDVNVYALPYASGQPLRLGTVVGTSTATFPISTHHLQPGDRLVVRIRAIGSRFGWTSEAVSIDSGVVAVLDVNTDAFGDCSGSSLHTVVVTDSVGAGR
jgi:hypothetical protein